jgi:hypothetical protein
MHQLQVGSHIGYSIVVKFVRFEVLTDVTMKGTFFWHLIICSLADVSGEHSASIVRSKSNPIGRVTSVSACCLLLGLTTRP